MKEGYEEINWKSKSEYVDEETGEKLDKEDAIRNYTIITKKKHTHVYKTTGTITYTNGCRRKKQLKLWE